MGATIWPATRTAGILTQLVKSAGCHIEPANLGHLWIKDFLLHRIRRVKMNNEFSAWHCVISDITQCSVLGPLLFVIFINDLPDTCSDFAEIFLFADDAKLFKHVGSAEDSAVLQRSCDRLFQWSNQWLL